MRAALAGGVTASPASPARPPAARRPVGGFARRSSHPKSAASTSTASTDGELNAYDVLGVDVTASHRAVRDAFRQKAKDAHPDRGGTPEAFDALKRAQDVLTDDGKRAALDARLLDVPIGSLSLEELKWSRELARLAEEEEAGEVRGADAVLASARAYAAAEKALEAIAAKKKKDAARRDEEKKASALAEAETRRLRNATMASRDEGRGDDREATLLLTREMLDTAFEASREASDVAVFALDVTVEANCPRCGGWGEKEGHWTMKEDKLCPKCLGFGRVEAKKTAQVPVRRGAASGETVTVRGAGNAGFRRQLSVLGVMGQAGEPGDLVVEVRILEEGRVK
jgi:molecular chaperone DnaJ